MVQPGGYGEGCTRGMGPGGYGGGLYRYPARTLPIPVFSHIPGPSPYPRPNEGELLVIDEVS